MSNSLLLKNITAHTAEDNIRADLGPRRPWAMPRGHRMGGAHKCMHMSSIRFGYAKKNQEKGMAQRDGTDLLGKHTKD
jgi:hypothetical protein